MFNRDVTLPSGLQISAIRRSIQYIEEKTSDLIDVYHEQKNLFSGLVGAFAIKALDTLSNYEKHRHSDIAQQRFPDLCRKGAPRPVRPEDALESKASMRAWAIQSHYDHAGWYIVWRYLVDATETIQPGKAVLIWRVDVVFLNRDDWKYEKSGAGSGGGGRTHTFGVKSAATKLRNCAVFERPDIVLKSGKPVPANGNHH